MDGKNPRKRDIPKTFEDHCLFNYGKVLTGKKQHLCPDWDYLPIDETCPEIECCTCGLKI